MRRASDRVPILNVAEQNKMPAIFFTPGTAAGSTICAAYFLLPPIFS
jgi:hypothetical protein